MRYSVTLINFGCAAAGAFDGQGGLKRGTGKRAANAVGAGPVDEFEAGDWRTP
jgi:hypothetical protein